jgi:hypothetical protein
MFCKAGPVKGQKNELDILFSNAIIREYISILTGKVG